MVDGLEGLTLTVGGDLGPLKQALDQIPQMARAAGEAAAAAMKAATDGGDGAGEAFTRAAYASRALADAMSTTAGAAVELDKELRQKKEDSDNAGQAFADLGQQITAAGSAMLILGGIFSGVSAGLVALTEESLQAAGTMEQATVSITRMGGSAEGAKTLIADLVNFAIATPFQVPGVVEAGQKLVAMGTATQDVIPMLRTLGDVASGSGKGIAGLNTLVQDFGKMTQLGVVHMRELNTLAYQGIPAIQALADAYGVSTNTMRKMVEQNLVGAADAIPILLEAAQTKFGGMMEQQAKTLLGMWSNVKDSVIKTFIAIGDALMPAAKIIVSMLTPILEGVQRMAEAFGKLPAPIQVIVVAAGVLAAAIGPVLVVMGLLTVAFGQLITAGPLVADFFGITLPAAFTRTTVAAGEVAVATEAAGAAASTASVGAGVLRGAVTALGTAAGIAAAAFVAWNLLDWAENNITPVTELFHRLENQSTALATAMGLLTGIGKIDPKQIQGVEDLTAALKQAGVTLERGGLSWDKWREKVMQAAQENGLFATAIDKSQRAMGLVDTAIQKITSDQNDANTAVEQARRVMEAFQIQVKMGVSNADELKRATKAYEDALNKAHPAIKAVSDEIDMQARAAQTDNETLMKWIKTWGTIPWAVFQGDVAGVTEAIKEQGFSITSTVKTINKMIDALELAAATSPAVKAIRDEMIATVNQLQDMGRKIDEAKNSHNAWVESLENGVIVWRRYQEEVKGGKAVFESFTQTIKDGIPAAQEYVDFLPGLGPVVSGFGDDLETAGAKAAAASVDLIDLWRSVGLGGGIIPSVDGQIKLITGSIDKLGKSADKTAANLAASTKSTHGAATAHTSLAAAMETTNKSILVNGEAFKTSTTGIIQNGVALASLPAKYDIINGKIVEYGAKASEAATATDKLGAAAERAGQKASLMAGSFLEGMNGTKASAEEYIAMLAAMPETLDSQVDATAAAMGYAKSGTRSYVDEAGAKKLGWSDDMIAMTFRKWNEIQAMFDRMAKEKADKDAAAAAATQKLAEAAAEAANKVHVLAGGADKVYDSFDAWAKDFGVNIMTPLGTSATDATGALDALGEVSYKTAAGVDRFGAESSRLVAQYGGWMEDFGAVTKVVKSTTEMWSEFPEQMQTAQAQTMKNLLDLGVNFYDASASLANFGGAVDEAALKVRTTAFMGGSDPGSALWDQITNSRVNEAKQLEDMKATWARELKELPRMMIGAATGVDIGLQLLEQNASRAAESTKQLADAQATWARELAALPKIQFGKPNDYFGPNGAGGRGPGAFVGNSPYPVQFYTAPTTTSFGFNPADFPQPQAPYTFPETVSNGSISITVTGNTILDDATATRLANTIMTRVTQQLRPLMK